MRPLAVLAFVLLAASADAGQRRPQAAVCLPHHCNEDASPHAPGQRYLLFWHHDGKIDKIADVSCDELEASAKPIVVHFDAGDEAGIHGCSGSSCVQPDLADYGCHPEGLFK
jgi:hypothetical protein